MTVQAEIQTFKTDVYQESGDQLRPAFIIPEPDELLTANLLREFSTRLPEPITNETIGNAHFSVYYAKPLFREQWNDPLLHRLAVEARKTYRELYGEDIPLLDEYDRKAATYLVRVEYPLVLPDQNCVQVEEWSSLRFVPGAGEPKSTEDLDFYVYDNTNDRTPILNTIIDLDSEFSGLTEDQALEHIATQSRFSAIRPSATVSCDQSILDQYKDTIKHPLSNGYSGLSFALMNREFIREVRRGEIPISLLTGQLHEGLSDRILSYPPNSGEIVMPFTPAYQRLGLDNSQSIRLDRSKPEVYAHRYPGYFLNLHDLTSKLDELTQQGILPKSIIEGYMPGDRSLDVVVQKPRMSDFNKFGLLLTTNGQIDGLNLTGEELRELIDSSVGDGPIFRIMRIDEFEEGANHMIEYAKQSGDLYKNPNPLPLR